MPKKRIAAIDLGTNTFNLLIADVFDSHFETLLSTKEGVALGMGGINDGMIAPDAFERAFNTLERFKHIASEYEVDEIRAIGTSAMREAKNAGHFVTDVKSKLGFEIEIVSGIQEANLIYKGVSWSYEFKEMAVIMDIGGGSTEFIFADSAGISSKASLNIGISRIFQSMKTSDPLSETDIEALEAWFEKGSGGFFMEKQAKILLGASGSFETLYEMIHETDFPKITQAIEIPMDELYLALNWMISSTAEERNKHDYIIEIRRKMLPIAAVKIRWILRKLGFEQVFVTPYSLKEGVL